MSGYTVKVYRCPTCNRNYMGAEIRVDGTLSYCLYIAALGADQVVLHGPDEGYVWHEVGEQVLCSECFEKVSDGEVIIGGGSTSVPVDPRVTALEAVVAAARIVLDKVATVDGKVVDDAVALQDALAALDAL